MKGTVKWFNVMKGFGFIEVEDGKDVFVHKTSLPEGIYLYEGDKVEFETEVIPVLKEYIDKSVAHKLENSKGDFKKLLLGVIADLIKSIDD